MASVALLLLVATAQASAATVTKAPQGNWVGVHGGDGYVLGGWTGSGDLSNLPAGTSLDVGQAKRYVWRTDAGNDVRALRSPDNTFRRAATWHDRNELALRLHFDDSFVGDLHVYALDYDTSDRRQTIEVGGETVTLGDSFRDGVWVTFQVSVAAGDSLTVRATRIAGANAAIGGLFLDETGPTVSQAPQGNWLGAFGADGYALGAWDAGGADDLVNLPNASLSLLRGKRYQWRANAGSDVRTLQSPDGTFRRAATWHDGSQLQLRLNFTSAYAGFLHLYALDYDGTSRRERIQVSGRSVTLGSSFNQGAWVHMPISVGPGDSLTITVDRIAGPNAVLGGIFLSGPQPTLRTTPALSPAFAADITDYVVRCDGSTPVQVEATSPSGGSASIDGRPPAGGTTSASVPLAAGQSFDVVLSSQTDQQRYHIRCLPSDFPAYRFTRLREPSQQWYIVTPSLGTGGRPYVALFNADGVPVWWYKADKPPIDAKLSPNGNLLWSFNSGGGFVTDVANTYQERRLDGTLVRSIKGPGGVATDDHDIAFLPNGNILTMAYVERDTTVDLSHWNKPSNAHVIDALIQEQDPGGNLVWSWNSKDHFAIEESDRWLQTLGSSPLPNGHIAYDIVHPNAIVPVGNSLYFSARHLDALFKIDRASGDILWKLGGTPTAKSLTVNGDPESYPLGGQHDLQPRSDGTVTVFDNATNLNRSPRAVRYRIDEAARTATWVEQVRDTALAGRSNCCGGARKLSNGGYVISWGGLPSFEEVAADGSKVWDLTFSPSTLFGYRIAPVGDGVLSPAQLRSGMDAQFPRSGGV